MDYTEEIAANNARIAELKAELAKLENVPTMGSDAMDYALAANRADYGDLSGAQYHLNKPEERARLAKLYELNGGSFNNDLETQYVTLQDNLLEAQRNKALTPKENKALVAQAEREEKTAKVRLKMFERKHPNLTKMHWKWRDDAGKELGFNGNTYMADAAPAGTNTIQAAKQLIFDNTFRDVGSGLEFWNEGADPYAIYAYLDKIPGGDENEEVRQLKDIVKKRQFMKEKVNADTLENLGVAMKDPSVTNKYGRIKTRKIADEQLEKWNKLSDAEKRSEAGQEMLRKIQAETQDERNVRLAKMDKEGREAARQHFGEDKKGYEMFMSGKDKSFNHNGTTWYMSENGKVYHK